MSKNLARKGLALATGLAFTSTAFAALPAYADDMVTLVPTDGSTYNTLNLSAFYLQSEIDPTADDTDKLTYKITNSKERDLWIYATNSDGGEGQSIWNVDETDANVDLWTNTHESDYDAGGYSEVNDDVMILKTDDSSIDTATGDNTLEIQPAPWEDGSDTTLKIQAWIDSNDDGIMGTFEKKTPERTLTFYKASNVTPTVTFVQAPERGVGYWSAKVTTDKSINLEELYSDVNVNLYRNGVEIDDNSASYDEDENALFTGEYYDSDAEATGTYKVRAEYDSSAWGTYSGTSVSSSGANSDVDGAYVLESGLDTANVIYDYNEDFAVRTGTKSVTFKAQIEDADGEDLKASGVKVRAIFSDNSLEDDTTVKSGSKTLTAGGNDITVETTTDSNGVATFTVASSAAIDGEQIDFNIEVLTADGWDENTNNLFGDRDTSGAIYWEDAYVDSFLVNGMIDGSSNDFALSTTKGGTLNVGYEIRDQWGQFVTSDLGTYKVEVDNNGGLAGNDDFVKRFAVSGGKANVSYKDDSNDTGSYDLDATLYELQDDGVTYNSISASSYNHEDLEINVVDNATAKTIDASIDFYGDNEGDNWGADYAFIDGHILASFDGRVTNLGHGWDLTNNEYSGNGYIDGYVYNADGDALPGAKVKFTAPAGTVVFTDENWDVFSLNTITVTTDSEGYFEVYIVSNKSGTTAISITSGSATASKNLKVEQADESDATKMTLKALKVAQSGAIVNVAAGLSDRWGNVVADSDISWDATGVGFLSASTSSTTGTGKPANVKLITGVVEHGVATITATSDYDSDITASVDVLVGVKATLVSKPAAGAVVSVKYAKGATIKVVRGTKSKTVVAATNTQKVTLKKGTGAVKVFVNGIRVLKK